MTEVTRMRRLIVQNADLSMYMEQEYPRIARQQNVFPFPERKTKTSPVVFSVNAYMG